jgi:lipopolysaccharide transport system permease protein
VVRIRPGRGWPRLDLAELWSCRELLIFLAWRDIKVRYQQTLLGVAWVALQPLLMTGVLALVLGRIGGLVSGGVPYPLFVLLGVVVWSHFAATLTSVVGSLVASAPLLTKVYFPRLVIPAAAAAARLVDLLVGLLIVAVGLGLHGVRPGPGWLLVPALVALSVLLALGLGLWLSVLNLRWRDVGHTMPFLLQVWMFATPVVFSASAVPERWRSLLVLNPMTAIVEAARAALLGQPVEVASLSLPASATTAILVSGLMVFRRLERRFADVV